VLPDVLFARVMCYNRKWQVSSWICAIQTVLIAFH